MTTAEQPVPRTVRELLFGHGADTPEAIARRLAAEKKLDQALQNLRTVTREIAVREIADTTAGLLGMNLVDIVIEGWRKHKELTAAARRTLAAPGSTELVELADHEITEEEQPYISLLVDDHRVATLALDATVVFDVHSLVAYVKAGRLVAVRAGHCDVAGTLAIEEVVVATGQARIPLHGVFSLGQGIRLLPAAEYSISAVSQPAADGGRDASRDER